MSIYLADQFVLPVMEAFGEGYVARSESSKKEVEKDPFLPFCPLLTVLPTVRFMSKEIKDKKEPMKQLKCERIGQRVLMILTGTARGLLSWSKTSQVLILD